MRQNPKKLYSRDDLTWMITRDGLKKSIGYLETSNHKYFIFVGNFDLTEHFNTVDERKEFFERVVNTIYETEFMLTDETIKEILLPAIHSSRDREYVDLPIIYAFALYSNLEETNNFSKVYEIYPLHAQVSKLLTEAATADPAIKRMQQLDLDEPETSGKQELYTYEDISEAARRSGYREVLFSQGEVSLLLIGKFVYPTEKAYVEVTKHLGLPRSYKEATSNTDIVTAYPRTIYVPLAEKAKHNLYKQAKHNLYKLIKQPDFIPQLYMGEDEEDSVTTRQWDIDEPAAKTKTDKQRLDEHFAEMFLEAEGTINPYTGVEVVRGIFPIKDFPDKNTSELYRDFHQFLKAKVAKIDPDIASLIHTLINVVAGEAVDPKKVDNKLVADQAYFSVPISWTERGKTTKLINSFEVRNKLKELGLYGAKEGTDTSIKEEEDPGVKRFKLLDLKDNPSWVKDDNIWKRAKQQAIKQYGKPVRWALVNYLYFQMGGRKKPPVKR